jgi:TolB protein
MKRAVAFAVAVAASLGAAGVSHAAFPGQNGKIVFRSNRTGNADLYTMSPDGSNRVQLTTAPSEEVDPRWSPDGARIAFASDRTHIFQIYTMNADGTDVRQVTTLFGHNRRPSWTADGRILFQSDVDDPAQARDIFVMNADGSGVTNLTTSPGIDDAFAAASPRGGKIVFSSDRSGEYRLYLMNGSASVRQLTSGGEDIQANWSPSGNAVVFVRLDSTFATSDLYLVHTDGSGLVRLTNTPNRTEFEPAWSPDGTKIVFHSCDPALTHCVNNVIGADGTGETDISTPRTPYLDTFSSDRIDPFWTPPSITGSGVSMTETNGQIEVTVPSTATVDPGLGFISLALNGQCQISGDFDIQVDYRLLSWPSPSGVDVGFSTFPPDFSSGHGMFVFDPGGGTGVSTGFPGPVNTFLQTPGVLSGTLRLARTGATITAYWLGPDGWTTLQTTSDSTTPTLFGLGVFSNIAHADAKVAYDNFRVKSGTFSCPTWWGDEAPDWQAVAGR